MRKGGRPPQKIMTKISGHTRNGKILVVGIADLFYVSAAPPFDWNFLKNPTN